MNDLIIKIRALAVELSARGIHAGHIEAGTQRRAAELNQQLVALFNTELEVTETGQRLPTSKGVILKSMIQHVVAAGFGARSHSQTHREERILSAAKALPELCDKLERKTEFKEWVRRRKELKETVEDQMMVLYKKDKLRTVAMESPEIAQILECSEQAVRKTSNKIWQMFKAEKEANKQRLTRRHTSDKTDDIDDE